MSTITDVPPTIVSNELQAFRQHLDTSLPKKKDGENLLIATWNIRAFASVTRTWTSSERDSPKRDLRAILNIAEIVRRFDVIALQEVKGDLRALRDLLRCLGDDWAFLMTDITLGGAGNAERMAFLFDTRRLKPSGLACELVVPTEWLSEVSADALRQQFARTPYAVSFKIGASTFILVTLHVTYGTDSADRIPELKGIARWLSDWARQEDEWSHNLIALGDFNIDRHGDALWQAFTSSGLFTPDDLNRVPRTVFSNPSKPDKGQFYDQIAWFENAKGVPKLNMTYRSGGYVDFLPWVYTELNLTKSAKSYRISDHFPLWAEFLLA